MALETAGNREDVEQERRAGITATARVLGVDRPSLQKWVR